MALNPTAGHSSLAIFQAAFYPVANGECRPGDGLPVELYAFQIAWRHVGLLAGAVQTNTQDFRVPIERLAG